MFLFMSHDHKWPIFADPVPRCTERLHRVINKNACANPTVTMGNKSRWKQNWDKTVHRTTKQTNTDMFFILKVMNEILRTIRTNHRSGSHSTSINDQKCPLVKTTNDPGLSGRWTQRTQRRLSEHIIDIVAKRRVSRTQMLEHVVQ